MRAVGFERDVTRLQDRLKPFGFLKHLERRRVDEQREILCGRKVMKAQPSVSDEGLRCIESHRGSCDAYRDQPRLPRARRLDREFRLATREVTLSCAHENL